MRPPGVSNTRPRGPVGQSVRPSWPGVLSVSRRRLGYPVTRCHVPESHPDWRVRAPPRGSAGDQPGPGARPRWQARSSSGPADDRHAAEDRLGVDARACGSARIDVVLVARVTRRRRGSRGVDARPARRRDDDLQTAEDRPDAQLGAGGIERRLAQVELSRRRTRRRRRRPGRPPLG